MPMPNESKPDREPKKIPPGSEPAPADSTSSPLNTSFTNPERPPAGTIVISYAKTDQGPRVVSVRRLDSPEAAASYEGRMKDYRRFEALFQGVPLHGGREWTDNSVIEIKKVMIAAADAIVSLQTDTREAAVDAHGQKSWLARKWSEFRGWTPPTVPEKTTVLHEMAERCERLASWMEANQSRPFYVGSDMSPFIVKPRAVARELRAEIAAHAPGSDETPSQPPR